MNMVRKKLIPGRDYLKENSIVTDKPSLKVLLSGKLQKVTMEFLFDDGSKLVRTLEGPQANAWNMKIEDVCVFAHVHGSNANWDLFPWVERIVKKATKSKRGKHGKTPL